MTEQRDPLLEALFAAEQQDRFVRDGERFTADVMSKTRRVIYLIAAILGGFVFLALIVVWIFSIPLSELVQFVSQALGATLFDLGGGWVSWVFAPVNNIASLLVLSIKGIRVIRKKILAATWSH